MTDEQPTFSNFEQFWDYYVSVHAHPLNRALHVGGTLCGIAMAGTGFLFKKRSLILLAPVVGYGCSWMGHFFVEHNTPATFQHPVWSFMGDMKMIKMTFEGKMAAEVERVLADKAAHASRDKAGPKTTETAVPSTRDVNAQSTNTN